MTGLSLRDVSHAYDGHRVVRGISLAVEPGEVVCLLGPSGCGKTTLLRLAAGLETLQEGCIAIGERPVAVGGGAQVPPEQRGVGLMFQDFALFPHLTIFDNVVFGLSEAAIERREWGRRVLERMGMASLANSYPHTLSGGQQQRVALLRALAPEPRVLLLDEPFSDLDANSRIQVREETLSLLKETRVATLMVTHDPEEAMFMADRILVMKAGAIIQSGTPRDIYFAPASSYVASLFGPVNRLAAKVSRGEVVTPLGRFPAGAFEEGRRTWVLVRPEAVRLTPCRGETGDGLCGRVISARLLGGTSHVRVGCEAGDGGEAIQLQARVPGVFLPDAGTRVRIAIDPAQAFVFAAS